SSGVRPFGHAGERPREKVVPRPDRTTLGEDRGQLARNLQQRGRDEAWVNRDAKDLGEQDARRVGWRGALERGADEGAAPREEARGAGGGGSLEREGDEFVVGGDEALRRDLGAGDRAHAVAHIGLRYVDARPAAQPCAPAEVEVLEVEEERLVESAELEQPPT